MSNCICCGKKLGGSEVIRCYQCKTNDNINDKLRRKEGSRESDLTNDDLQGIIMGFWFVLRGIPYINQLFEWELGNISIFFFGSITGFLIHYIVKSFFLRRFKIGRYLYLGLNLILLVDVGMILYDWFINSQ